MWLQLSKRLGIETLDLDQMKLEDNEDDLLTPD